MLMVTYLHPRTSSLVVCLKVALVVPFSGFALLVTNLMLLMTIQFKVRIFIVVVVRYKYKDQIKPRQYRQGVCRVLVREETAVSWWGMLMMEHIALRIKIQRCSPKC